MLRALWPYFHRYRGQVALGLLCVILGNLFQLAGPQFLRRGIDAIADGRPFNTFALMAAGLLGAALLTGAARLGMRQLLNGLSRRIEYDIRNDLYRHLERLEPAFFRKNATGDLMALSTNDLGAVRMVAGPALMYATETLTRIAMALPLMLAIDRRLTLIAAIPMFLVPVAIVALGPLIERRFEAVQAHFGTLSTFVHENLSGVRVVRAYQQEEPQIKAFEATATEYLRKNLALARAYGLLFPLVTLLGGAGGVITLWYGGLLVMRGTVSLGTFIAFGTYLALLTWPMIAFGWVINLFQRGAASMRRIQKILDQAPAIADPAAVAHLPDGPLSVEFRQVSFAYADRTTQASSGLRPQALALEQVSFTAPAGRWTAVVGATGSGKSSVVELLPRLADPQQGQVLIGGVDVRQLTLAELRAAIGFVPQDAFLFSQTIGENISLGERSTDAVEAATRVAQFASTIEALPSRYETMLGERGINLSGGQKQRATIARALAGNPRIVVLDDALSAVDTETEAALLRALRDELAGRTVLVVSHRITAVQEADLIVVLDEGRVIETGRHDDLIEKKGRYWELLRRQLLEESLATA